MRSELAISRSRSDRVNFISELELIQTRKSQSSLQLVLV
jgi:hypothetical protein